ncbi:type II secretion system secretin GspD [Halomonas urumqiensis]|uniref:type II secretion system secretin GspD n=1 Tax=Halomonas urumqiensis TaxID=1684789 RepID=UPI0015E141D4|nr:type II secretion system secretin GspD [Halomonas urumqiensis]GHE20913.1 type II secretion system protein GspD [Halomonas urumqiensis]
MKPFIVLLGCGVLAACSATPQQPPRPWWEGAGSTGVTGGGVETAPFETGVASVALGGDTQGVSSALYPGTGEFVRLRQPSAEVTTEQGDITLNFEMADVREVVNTILGELLGLNYLVAPDVSGQVTLQTSRPVTADALLRILEDVLTASGLALVERDGVYQVVTAANAAGVSRGNLQWGGAGFGTRVVPLEYVSAAEMADLLEPFAPEQGILRVDPGRNLLVLSGSARDLDQLQEMVETFDVDWLDGMSVGLVALEHARADVVVDELGAMLGEASPIGDLIRLIPLQRLNAVLVVTPQRRYLGEMRNWLNRLDQPLGGEGRRLYVYRVENGNAVDLAEIMRELFAAAGNGQQAGNGRSAAELAPGLRQTRIYSPPREGDDPPQVDLGGPLVSGTATSAADNGMSAFDNGTAARSGGMGDIGVIADEANNALVILATPSDYSTVEDALRQLDIRPLQVLVEATIVDVTLSDELAYGIQWFLRDRINGGRAVAQFGQALSFGSSFSLTLSNSAGEVRALLRALADEGKVEVLSSPSLMVLDNHTASIQVGDQQPVTTSIITEGGLIAESVQFRDTGVILDVTPRVNSGGLITMDIRQEVTDVGETDAATGQRAFLQRNIESKVAVQSGDTLVLGGLIRENRAQTRSGVPGLYRLPVIGPALFGQTVNAANRSELLVLITPRAIRSREDAGRVTEEFRSKLGRLRDWDPRALPRGSEPAIREVDAP